MADKDKSKGMASLIVGKLSGEKEEEKPEVESDEKEEDIAVEEMMAALKADDKAKFKEALESFIELCVGKEDVESESEQE